MEIQWLLADMTAEEELKLILWELIKEQEIQHAHELEQVRGTGPSRQSASTKEATMQVESG